MTSTESIIKKFIYFLVLLLPYSLVSGPFLPDLTIIFLSLYFLYKQFQLGNLKYFNNVIFKIIVIFNFWIILSSLMSVHFFFSIQTSIFYFRFLLFSLAIWYLLENYENFSLFFFYSLLSCFIILIIDGFFQFFFGYNIIGMELVAGPRVSSFFGKELILGSYLSRLSPLLLGLYFFNINKFSNPKKMSIIIILILILSTVIVFLSGERASFFYINLSSLFIMIFMKKINLKIIFMWAISIFIIISLVSLKPISKNRIVNLTINQLEIDNNKFTLIPEAYKNFYVTGLNIFKANAIVGSGPKTFRLECSNVKYKRNDQSCATHPHSTYIQLMSETGIVGFLFVFLLFLKIIFDLFYEFLVKKKQLKNNFRSHNYKICIIVCFIISLWPLSPSGNFFNNWLNIVYYLPLGFFMHLIYEKNKT